MIIDEILAKLPVGEEHAISASKLAELLDHRYSLGTLAKYLKANPELIGSRLVKVNNIKVRLYWKRVA